MDGYNYQKMRVRFWKQLKPEALGRQQMKDLQRILVGITLQLLLVSQGFALSVVHRIQMVHDSTEVLFAAKVIKHIPLFEADSVEPLQIVEGNTDIINQYNYLAQLERSTKLNAHGLVFEVIETYYSSQPLDDTIMIAPTWDEYDRPLHWMTDKYPKDSILYVIATLDGRKKTSYPYSRIPASTKKVGDSTYQTIRIDRNAYSIFGDSIHGNQRITLKTALYELTQSPSRIQTIRIFNDLHRTNAASNHQIRYIIRKNVDRYMLRVYLNSQNNIRQIGKRLDAFYDLKFKKRNSGG